VIQRYVIRAYETEIVSSEVDHRGIMFLFGITLNKILRILFQKTDSSNISFYVYIIFRSSEKSDKYIQVLCALLNLKASLLL
jgi:hypothetical protein